MASSTKSLTKEKIPIRYRLQMKLVQILPPKYDDKTTNRETKCSIWCGKPIQLDQLYQEITTMLPRFIEKVHEKVKI